MDNNKTLILFMIFVISISSIAGLTQIANADPDIFLVIDEESIDNGNPPNFFSDVDGRA